MKKFVLFLFSFFCFVRPAHPNDGSITWGEAPRLTSTHPSVTMQSEIVRLSVGKTETIVDCRFVFVNNGPACTVRMGFPDHSDDDPISDGGRFSSFRSWVDGREIKTRSVLGPLEDGFREQWRVKTVRFGARGTRTATRHVRDVYAVDARVDMRTSTSVAYYVLHTGSSWRGPIGRSDIVVTFPDWRGPFHPVPRPVWKDDAEYKRIARDMRRPGTVAYAGPGKPSVRDKSLRWVRTNWRPTLDDDIQIHFQAP